jgi:hypothetical protein
MKALGGQGSQSYNASQQQQMMFMMQQIQKSQVHPGQSNSAFGV